MKVITDIKDDELFLGYMYDAAEVVADALEDTQVLEIRKRKPKFTGNETKEEKAKMMEAQAKKNIRDMARRLFKEKPKSTIAIFRKLVILEDGEDYPHGPGLITSLLKLLTNKEIIDFLLSLIKLERELSNESSEESTSDESESSGGDTSSTTLETPM